MVKVVGLEISEETNETYYIVMAPYLLYKKHFNNFPQVKGSYDNVNKTIAVKMTGEEVIFNKFIDSDVAFRIMETEALKLSARSKA